MMRMFEGKKPVELEKKKVQQEINEKKTVNSPIEMILMHDEKRYDKKYHLRQQLHEEIAVVPDELIDPISFDIYKDPVLTPCTHLFSSSSIHKALEHNHECPICRQKLDAKQLVSEKTIDGIVNEFVCYQNQLRESINLDLTISVDGLLQHRKNHQDKINQFKIQFTMAYKKIEEERTKKVKIQRTQEIESKRQAAIKSLDQPVAFFYDKPGISICGHVNDEGVSWCFTCGKQFEKFPVVSCPELLNELNGLKKKCQILKKEIDSAGKIEPVTKSIQAYLQKLESLLGLDETAQRHYQKLYKTLFIKDRKEALKIDIRNRDHLVYWHGKTKHCWHGYGGVKVVLHDETFRVPTRVYHVMQSSRGHFATAEEFLGAIDLERKQKPTWFNYFFSCSMTRSAETDSVYESDSLAQLKLE